MFCSRMVVRLSKKEDFQYKWKESRVEDARPSIGEVRKDEYCGQRRKNQPKGFYKKTGKRKSVGRMKVDPNACSTNQA